MRKVVLRKENQLKFQPWFSFNEVLAPYVWILRSILSIFVSRQIAFHCFCVWLEIQRQNRPGRDTWWNRNPQYSVYCNPWVPFIQLRKVFNCSSGKPKSVMESAINSQLFTFPLKNSSIRYYLLFLISFLSPYLAKILCTLVIY